MTTKEKIEKIIEFEVKNNSVFTQIDLGRVMRTLFSIGVRDIFVDEYYNNIKRKERKQKLKKLNGI